MPISKGDIPRLLEAGMKTVFQEAAAAAKPDYEKICTVVPTDTETNSYGWLGAPPVVREFTDERVAKGLSQFGLSITDKTWEATIGVSRRQIENDQYGMIMMRVRELAQQMVKGVNKHAFTALLEGNSATGASLYGRSWDNYDAKGDLISGATIYFNDTDHSYPAPSLYTTNQSNKSADALTSATLGTAITAMQSWKDSSGEPLGENTPDLLIVPPKLQWTALEICTSAIAPAANAAYKNVMAGAVEPLTSSYWVEDAAGNTQNWGVYNTRGVVKPLILQLFTPAANGQLFEFEELEASSESGFMRDMYYYGIRGRWNIGYANWQTSYLNVVA